MIADEVLIRRAEVVAIHLDILAGLLSEPAGVSSAIRASMSLRFLMDGTLNQVARDFGAELAIPTPDLADIPINETIVFACGGYTIGSAEFGPFYGYRMPGPHSAYRSQFERQSAASPAIHTFVDLKFGKFIQSKCLAMLGETLSREAVVRYVANKCGGAHHHDDSGKFEDIDHRMTKVGHVLEKDGAGLSAVFLETLGTAYFLLSAPSLNRLRSDLAAQIQRRN